MATYIKIASNIVGSGGVASVTFSSIPGTYSDLVVKISARTDNTGSRNRMTFNGSSVADYSERMVYGDGSAAASAALSGNTRIEYIYVNTTSTTASTFSSNEIYIPNYAGSNNKSVSIDGVYENNGTAALQNLDAALWAKTNAITSITFTPETGNFAQHTTFTLYGISNA